MIKRVVYTLQMRFANQYNKIFNKIVYSSVPSETYMFIRVTNAY